MNLIKSKNVLWVTVFALLVGYLFCFRSGAQTNTTTGQKADEVAAGARKDGVFPSAAGTIISTNDGVTITQGPGATAVPEGPEPQGGWFAPLYTAEGVLNSYRMTSSNSFAIEYSFPFSYSPDDKDRWQAEYSFYNKNMDIMATNYFFCDGTNVYKVLVSDRYVDRDDGVRNNSNVSNPGRVYPGSIPSNLDSAIGLLWMTFSAGNYISLHPTNQKNGVYKMVDIFSNPSTYPSAWCCDLQYTFLTNSLNSLISKGSFILNTNYISENDYDYLGLSEETVKSDYNKMQFEILKKISAANLLCSSFSVDKIKTIDSNLTIPISFSCERYSLDEKKSFPFHRIEGVVTNINSTHRVFPMFTKLGTVSVQDFRFRFRTKDEFRDSIFYLCKNEWELTMDSPKLRSAGSQEIHKRTFVKDTKGKYYASLVTLILVIFLPFLFFSFKGKKSKNNQ